MPRDIKLLVTNYTDDQMFTDTSSFSLLVGGTWGECDLCISKVDLSNEALENDRMFTNINLNDAEAVYDQYCNLPFSYQERHFGVRQTLNRDICGIALGASTTILKNLISNLIVQKIGDFFVNDTAELVTGAAQTGFASSGRVFKGLNGYETFYLGHEDLTNLNVFLIQFSAQAVLGVACNIVFIGNFSSVNSILLSSRTVTASVSSLVSLIVGATTPIASTQFVTGLTANVSSAIASYVNEVMDNSIGWAIINEAAAGVLLPGIDVKILGSR